MIIKFQLNAPLKFPAPCRQFIVSYQDEDIYRYIYTQIKKRHSDTNTISISLEQSTDWQCLMAQTNNYQLLPESNLYEIALSKPAFQLKTLPELQPLDTDLYLFKTTEFKHQLLSNLEKQNHSVWIQAYNPQLLELWQWLQNQLHQFDLDSSLKPWFLQQTGIQFRHCWQVVEKFNLNFKPKSHISLQDFKEGLGVQTDDNWQPLMDAWMCGNLPDATLKLRQTLNSQQELSLLIWLLGRNLQVLFALKQGIQSPQEIFSVCKIWPKQTQAFMQAQTRFSLKQLSSLIHELQEIEQAFKSGLNKRIPLMLERFFIHSFAKELL